MAELVGDELIRTEGTHSTIDCPRVVKDVPTTDAGWLSLTYGRVIPA
jgi:hypothetical protein